MDDIGRLLSLLGLLEWDHPGPAGVLLAGAFTVVTAIAGSVARICWTVCRSHFRGEVATLNGQITLYEQRVILTLLPDHACVDQLL
jgi:hypothetical protein